MIKFRGSFALLMCLLLAVPVAFSQTVTDSDTTSVEGKVRLTTFRMNNARQMFLDNNVRGALNEYRIVQNAQPDNAQAIYRIGECHYALKNYELALSYFDKAETLDPGVNKELAYWKGMTFHRLAKLDQAIEQFNTFKRNTGKATNYYYDVDTYIEQCQFAQMMMQHPRDVTMENLDRRINSRFDDYTPSITADGKLLVFTSRRPDIKGGGIDTRGDHKYFENIFYSEWDAVNQEWTAAEQLKGQVNTTAYDAVLSIAPDGKSMYVYKNNAQSAGDIFFSTFVDSTSRWTAAEKLPKPINTSYFESSVSITADGKHLYFISERPGGEGQGDIYVSEKHGDKWGKPKNLGNLVNTSGDEKFVFVHPNGKHLFFASNGHQTMGSYDIFRCEIIDGKATRPINLGYPINTVNEESTFSLTADNKTMYIAAEYSGGQGERDIWRIDLSNYKIVEDDIVAEVYFQGTVIDANTESRFKNAQVLVYSKAGKLIYDVKTDKFGEFEMKLLRGDVYEFEVKTGVVKDKKFSVDLKNIENTRLVVVKSFEMN
jgi:tetratricopeptide (TPR) repeat protein